MVFLRASVFVQPWREEVSEAGVLSSLRADSVRDGHTDTTDT